MATQSPFAFLGRRRSSASASRSCSRRLGGPRDAAPRGAVPQSRAPAGARGHRSGCCACRAGWCVSSGAVRRWPACPRRPACSTWRPRALRLIYAGGDAESPFGPGPCGLRAATSRRCASRAMCNWPAEVNWLVDHVRWESRTTWRVLIGDVPAHTSPAAPARGGGAAAVRAAVRPGRRAAADGTSA